MAYETSIRPPLTVPPAALAAEDRARAFLAQRKWRKAREELKPLLKIDRSRYLPLLIQANQGLAREMMARGQVAEAQQVLAYLATIAPADAVRSLEIELMGKVAPSAASASRGLALLAGSGAPLSQEERLRVADQLVILFEPLTPADSSQADWVEEVKAIQDGLQALALAQWDQVAEALRKVPHRSALSHWTLFVKGLVAFHNGMADKAARLLRSLPPGTVPARAGRAYLLLLDKAAQTPDLKTLAEPDLDVLGQLMRRPGAVRLVIKADRHWHERKPIESYRVLRDGLPDFPSDGADWVGELSSFYFKSPPTFSGSDRESIDHYFNELVCGGRAKSGHEAMLASRMLALGRFADSGRELRTGWEYYLRVREQLHGSDARFASIAMEWLGRRLAEKRASGFASYATASVWDARGAQEALRTSIELDPSNLTAHLAYCDVLQELGRKAERNRLLDSMTRRFADEKEVLHRAARHCLERKAFLKGLDYLERALPLDRLDPALPMDIAFARRSLAKQYYAQGRADRGRAVLAGLESLLTDKAEDLILSRWSARLREGALELLYGDADRGRSLVADGRDLFPRQDACLLFAHLACRYYAPLTEGASPFRDEMKGALRVSPNLASARLLIEILRYWERAVESVQVHAERSQLAFYLQTAAKQPFARSDALRVIELIFDDPKFLGEVRALIKRGLREDREDPQFRLFDLLTQDGSRNSMSVIRSKLAAILETATRRRDDATVRKIQGMLRSLDDRSRLIPDDPFDHAPTPWEEEETDEGSAFDDAFLAPDLPPEASAAMGRLLEVLRHASDSEIRLLRKSLRKEMPDFIFNMLVEAAKSGVLPPFLMPHHPPQPPPRVPAAPQPIRPAPQRPKSPQPNFSDPRQLDLI